MSVQQMINLISSLLKWVPSVITITIVIIPITLTIALTVTAVTTERSVSFWPPQIGDGPKTKIVKEIGELQNDVIMLKNEYLKQIQFNREQSAMNRERAAGTQKDGGTGYIKYDMNADYFDKEVKEMESNLAQKLQNLDSRITKIKTDLD